MPAVLALIIEGYIRMTGRIRHSFVLPEDTVPLDDASYVPNRPNHLLCVDDQLVVTTKNKRVIYIYDTTEGKPRMIRKFMPTPPSAPPCHYIDGIIAHNRHLICTFAPHGTTVECDMKGVHVQSLPYADDQELVVLGDEIFYCGEDRVVKVRSLLRDRRKEPVLRVFLLNDGGGSISALNGHLYQIIDDQTVHKISPLDGKTVQSFKLTNEEPRSDCKVIGEMYGELYIIGSSQNDGDDMNSATRWLEIYGINGGFVRRIFESTGEAGDTRDVTLLSDGTIAIMDKDKICVIE